MSLMTKALILSSILFSGVYANSIVDKKVLDFEKKRLSSNERVKIVDVKINLKKDMPLENWYGYIIDVKAKVAGKTIDARDIIFSNGKAVTPELFDIKTGETYKDLLAPSLTSEYYNKEHLIAGNANAKDKLVIFSDPLCPFCIDFVPEVIKHVQKNKNDIALYYYHLPLTQIHPAAVILVKAMIVAKQNKIKNIEQKVYTTDFEKYFKSNEKDEKKILAAFNKEFKTNIKPEDINKPSINSKLIADLKLAEKVMVKGTPTIFVNGKQDKTRVKYEMLGN